MATNKRDVEFIIRAKNQASSAFEAVSKALEELNKTQNEVSASSSKATTTLDAFAKIATTVGGVYNQLASDSERAAAAFKRQEATLAENKARLESLTQQMQAAQRVQQSMQQRMREFVGPLMPQQVKDSERQLKLVEKAYADLAKEASRLTTVIERDESALRASFYALQEISGGAERAAQALAKVEQAQRQAAAAATAAAAQQEKEAAAMQKAAAAAQRRSALETRRDLDVAAKTAYAGWKDAEQAIRELNIAIRQSGQASSEQVARLAALQAQARANKTAYEELRITIEQYRRVLRDQSASQEQVVAAQQRAQAAIRGAQAAMAQEGAEARKNAQSTRQMGEAKQRAARQTDELGRSLQSLFANSRRSLSYYQRIRGEVLALITSYAGLYAAIQGVTNVIQASMSMQAVESRLNVVTGGNAQATAHELVWIREQADRLGFSIQSMANEWSKFAVAAQASNFEMADTRKIFISVSEAARVLKLNSQQVERAYVALTQMISKGKITAEELRQQLGEHIPGAFAMMAEAVGVTTAELDKMLEQGQVTTDNLVKFADVLDKRFGGQLPNALQTTQAELGRFQTAVTLALNAIGEAGVMETFTDALVQLRELLRSDEAQVWFERIGAGISSIIKMLMSLLENLDLIAVGFAGLAAAKGVGYLLKLNDAIRKATVGLAGTAAAVRGLGVAFAGLGGVAGLAFGVAVTAISYLVTRISDSEKAIVSARKSVEQITHAYRTGAKEADKWKASLEGLTALQLEREYEAVRNKYEETLAQISNPFGFFFQRRMRAADSPLREVFEELERLIDAAREGKVPISEFHKRLDEIGQAHPELREVATRLQDMTREAGKAEKEFRQMDAAMRLMKGQATDADKALLGLKEATKDLTDELNKGQTAFDRYIAAMDKLAEKIPALRDEVKYQQELQKIIAIRDQALQEAGDDQVLRKAAYDRANQAIEALERGFKEAIDKILPLDNKAIIERIINVESGGSPLARARTSSAAGLGQFVEGTWLRLFDQVFPELANMTREAKLAMRTNTEASRKMLEVLTRQNQAGLIRAGIEPNARNTYLAHFLGISDAIKVILANPNELAANIVQQQSVAANKGILGGGKTVGQLLEWANRKMGGGAPLESSGWTEAEIKSAETAKKTQETIQKINEELTHRIELIGKSELQQEIYNQTVAKGISLQSKEGQEIAAKVKRLWEAEQAVKAGEKAEKRINDLLALRKEIQEQIEFNQGQGNVGVVQQLGIQLEDVNRRLREAIDNALSFWEAMGGEKAELAIARLNNIKASLIQTNTITLDTKKLTQDFASGLSNAFLKMGDAIGAWISGAKSGKEAIRDIRDAFLQFAADFLRQIAQMIMQQIIFNMVSGWLGGGGILGGTLGTSTAGFKPSVAFKFHDGGIVGFGGAPSLALPEWFGNAMRYHTGGIAGLRPNEIPAILERGEEVLTRDDPRHSANGGQAQANVKVVNAFDAPGFLNAALNTRDGEQVIMNFVRANSGAIRTAIGI